MNVLKNFEALFVVTLGLACAAGRNGRAYWSLTMGTPR